MASGSAPGTVTATKWKGERVVVGGKVLEEQWHNMPQISYWIDKAIRNGTGACLQIESMPLANGRKLKDIDQMLRADLAKAIGIDEKLCDLQFKERQVPEHPMEEEIAEKFVDGVTQSRVHIRTYNYKEHDWPDTVVDEISLIIRHHLSQMSLTPLGRIDISFDRLRLDNDPTQE